MTQLTNPDRDSLADDTSGPSERPFDDSSVIACDWTTIAPEHRATHQALVNYLLFDAAEEVRELPDGYALRFTSNHYEEVAGFIANERLCCPFINFGLAVSPAQGPVWLQLTGQASVKDFLKTFIVAH